MIITLDNLKIGIHWWQKGNWPMDIHNSDYYEIYDARVGGITEGWWDATVDRLSQWRAFRGPKPPNTKAEIRTRGRKIVEQLTREYESLLGESTSEPSIMDASWENIDGLFGLAAGIQNSPVFAGKMCHFMFPKLFIIMDNQATSVFDYEFYWRGMQAEWNRFDKKEAAERYLIEA
ncbi:MAG: hypothetical protein KAU50_08510, partial [Candidatus Marinimicrobia bacterium]|nr:hypothetical protein [Candidatus Neomarinimicrobiota bacterium]